MKGERAKEKERERERENVTGADRKKNRKR